MFENKIILITGGTGSWGQCLTKRLLKENVKEIRIYSRNEASQVSMQRKFNNEKIKFIIGDVRNEKRLIEAMTNVDFVFHLAALKHVPICEYQPTEAIETNINGTINVIRAAKINNVNKVIAVSSDKAVSPHNVYGMTKAIEEKLMIIANKESSTKYVCIRAGNVMGFAGSVIPLFINQLNNKQKITITDKNMTRFFITLDEAIELLIKATFISYGGEIFVMNMPSLNIIDLVTVLNKYYGNDNLKINYIGIRPGEKIHEELINSLEMLNTYKIDENYFLIVPETMKDDIYKNYKNLIKTDLISYTSKDNLLNIKQIEERLKKGHFI